HSRSPRAPTALHCAARGGAPPRCTRTGSPPFFTGAPPVRRFLAFFVFLTVVIGTGCSPGGGGGDSAVPIVVGYVATLLGDYSGLGSDNELAVELAVEQINEDGGVLGRPVELLTRDDQSSPDQSVLAFTDLQSEDPVAVIG